MLTLALKPASCDSSVRTRRKTGRHLANTASILCITVHTALVFSTLGAGSSDEDRIRRLTSGVATAVFSFDRSRKMTMFWQLLRQLRSTRPDLVIMEGTGVAGGIALIIARKSQQTKYVVSSGDAVGPWVGSQYRLLEPLFTLYEKLLYRNAVGIIGWTPYIVGRAMTFGTRRGMTAAGWAPFVPREEDRRAARVKIRRDLGIPQNAIVVGIAGSLAWSKRHRFCYGLDIVNAVTSLKRRDVYALIVGDGTGRAHLEAIVNERQCDRVRFMGRVSQREVADFLCAMDIGSVPQTVDAVGGFRYTTKISEYLACRLPMVTSQIPMAYDLDAGWIWRIEGDSPWSDRSHDSLTALLEHVTSGEIEAKRESIPTSPDAFNVDRQVERATAFLTDVMA